MSAQSVMRKPPCAANADARRTPRGAGLRVGNQPGTLSLRGLSLQPARALTELNPQ